MRISAGRNRKCGAALSALFALAFSHFAQALPGVWSAAGDMANARYQHTARLLPSGKVLVAGELSGSGSAELFDAASGTWSAAASMATGRGAASASLLSNGTVLVAGGNPANNCTINETTTGSTTVCYATTSAEIYSPGGNVWTPAAAMPTARQGQTATVLASGKVLIAGGASDCTTVIDPSTETFYCTYVSTAALYDPAGNTWSAAGSLDTGRLYHTATLLASGKVLVTGGRNGNGAIATSELYDPATNTWSAAGSLGTARFNQTATLLLSGKVYIAGGSGNLAALASAELFDPATSTWSAAPNLNTARSDHTATLLPSGKVLIAAGDQSGSATLIANPDLYDPQTNTVTQQSAMIEPRYGATATLLQNGHVMLTGGEGVNGKLASTELFDTSNSTYTVTASAGAHGSIFPPTQIVNGGDVASFMVTPDYASSVLSVTGDTCTVTHDTGTTWTTAAIHADCAVTASFLGPMSAARYDFTATLLQSGKVLLAGGADSATADLYDPVSKTLTPTGMMVSSRYGHSATLLASGKVLVAGGTISTSSSTQLATTELYDPASNTWSAGASMNKGRAGHAATLLNSGSVLVVGSMTGGPTGSADIYNPTSGTWSAAAAPSYERSRPTATTLTSGKVLLIGGFSTTTQLYNPTTNTWTTGGAVAYPVYGQTATLLTSGKVLIAGGEDQQGNSTVSASLYDPASNTWSVAANMGTARISHTATLLPTGKVLVLGGYTSLNFGDTFLASAESYDATANAWTASSALSEPRYGHNATPLSSGQILVSGGDATGSVELYGNPLPDHIFANGFETN